MKTTKYITLFILALSGIFTACKKMNMEKSFEFPIYEPAPPRTVDINPDSTLAFKLHFHDSTYNTQMMAEKLNWTLPPSFSLQAKLNDRESLEIQLPLNDSGYISAGKYIVRNNRAETGILTPQLVEFFRWGGSSQPYSFFAGYPNPINVVSDNDTAKYSFTLVMEIDSMNRKTHLITGFIDTLLIVDKADTSRKVLITDGEFAILYNHFEIEVNGILETPDGQWVVRPYGQAFDGGWAGTMFSYSDGRQFSGGWHTAIWSPENVTAFNTNKGKGRYLWPFTSINTDFPIYYSTVAGDFIIPSDTTIITLDNFYTNQFAKGSIEYKGKEVDLNTYTDFAPASPEYKIKVFFAYRILL
ncbi:hypothetical protein MRBLMN1_001942 [Chitinophaga ginsengisegetis]|uniref:hypothetical protein n=1 Tax=Chitinophaga ginsengisegetis TaxID=393003 RepID=UPI000DB9B384|nr:hypothetical protein [Chitinophaga ginsengisegetis]MDR6569610.1 hypothetical protein [Chitinophaga ginsengisegetis]MDR6649343.1 hypothetical protein [Chitinophaga ginsengisegetis]MDR6655693.1 hypothetical protein [Chitinophaga ginsengisegetis]